MADIALTHVERLKYWHNAEPKCPHCDANFDVWSGDNPLSLSYEDGGKTEFECRSCRKIFICVTAVQYEFSTAATDEAADDEQWGPAMTALNPAPASVAHGNEVSEPLRISPSDDEVKR